MNNAMRVQRVDRIQAAIRAGGYWSKDWANDGGYFEPKENPPPNSERWHTISGIKYEVQYLHDEGVLEGMEFKEMNLDSGFYGSSLGWNIRHIQLMNFLKNDGVIGPRTMRAIMGHRVNVFQHRLGIRNDHCGRTMMLESDLYGACRNSTLDFSYSQDHDPMGALPGNSPTRFADGKLYAPDGDWKWVYRIGRNVRLLCEHMAYYRQRLATIAETHELNLSENDLDRAMVMSHNAPAWAENWMLAGFPTEGGPVVHIGDFETTEFDWCTRYTKAEAARTW